MTNVPPPPPSDVPPPSGATPPPAAPQPSPYSAPAGTPGGGVKQGLSLTSFILGVGSLVILSWIPFLGLLASAAAVVLAFMGKSREPNAPKWMWLVGMITGFVGVAIGLIYAILFIIGIAALSQLSQVPTY